METTAVLPNFKVGEFLLVDGYHGILAIHLRINKGNQFVKPFCIAKLGKNPSFFIEGTLLYCMFVIVYFKVDYFIALLECVYF